MFFFFCVLLVVLWGFHNSGGTKQSATELCDKVCIMDPFMCAHACKFCWRTGHRIHDDISLVLSQNYTIAFQHTITYNCACARTFMHNIIHSDSGAQTNIVKHVTSYPWSCKPFCTENSMHLNVNLSALYVNARFVFFILWQICTPTAHICSIAIVNTLRVWEWHRLWTQRDSEANTGDCFDSGPAACRPLDSISHIQNTSIPHSMLEKLPNFSPGDASWVSCVSCWCCAAHTAQRSAHARGFYANASRSNEAASHHTHLHSLSA